MLDAGIEVIYDDRKASVGAMLADADLLGVPVRVVIGPKNAVNGEVEIVTRDKRYSEKVSVDAALDETKKMIAKLFAEINEHVKER